MGFPVGCTELVFPKLFLQILSVLGFLNKILSCIFRYLWLHHYLEPDFNHLSDSEDTPYSTRMPEFDSVSALLIRENLPVVKFSELAEAPESCAVCLYEFEGDDEIRRLANCRHVFHRGCLDRWMGYDQRTCPLCRTPFIPHHMETELNQSLWAASGIPESYPESDSDYYPHLSSL